MAIFTDAREIVWVEHERVHLNVLELTAAFIGIHTYCHNRSYKHIRAMSDSPTAIEYINNKGGIKSMQCVFKKIISSLPHTYQENTILKQTNFLEN